jgi:hypothetical protein
LAPLIFYDIALVIQLLLIQRREKEAHAIRFKVKTELYIIAWYNFKIGRGIGSREAVDIGADFLQEFEMFAVFHMLRTLEHHMLEQVGETGAFELFILRADVVNHYNRRHRRGVILVKNDGESVVELVLFKLDVYLRIGSCDHGDQESKEQEILRHRIAVGLWVKVRIITMFNVVRTMLGSKRADPNRGEKLNAGGVQGFAICGLQTVISDAP